MIIYVEYIPEVIAVCKLS